MIISFLVQSRKYDCLSQRMQAAALSGHGGAQLAVCREDALGAKIEVWWDGDKQYYPATVANWDPASTEYVKCPKLLVICFVFS